MTDSERSYIKRHPYRELIRGRARPLGWVSRATTPTPPYPRPQSVQRMGSTSPCHDLAVLQVHDEGDSDGLRGIPSLAIQWRISPDFTAGALFTHDRGLVPVLLEVPPVFIGTPRVAFTAEAPINGGTSGGPCLTEKGRVLTPVSFTGSPDHCTGYGAALGVSLPRWLAVEIWRAERDLG